VRQPKDTRIVLTALQTHEEMGTQDRESENSKHLHAKSAGLFFGFCPTLGVYFSALHSAILSHPFGHEYHI
jgi:hypothetical protein